MMCEDCEFVQNYKLYIAMVSSPTTFRIYINLNKNVEPNCVLKDTYRTFPINLNSILLYFAYSEHSSGYPHIWEYTKLIVIKVYDQFQINAVNLNTKKTHDVHYYCCFLTFVGYKLVYNI